MTTVLNFAPAVVDKANNTLFSNTDYLILNEVEVEQLTKFEINNDLENVKKATLTLLEMFDICNGVIVTLGEKGVLYTDKSTRSTLHVESKKVKVVDTSVRFCLNLIYLVYSVII